MRLLAACAVATALALTITPVHAATPPGAPPESYLYIVDAQNIRVKPSKDGTRAKVILTGATVTRFSDRPFRHEHYLSVQEMFREFGWDSQTLRWADPTPNTGVSVAGHRTEIVDIQRAKGDEKRLVLYVKDVRYTLEAIEGVGAVFIDNVEELPEPDR
jgi:hypothetical protein